MTGNAFASALDGVNEISLTTTGRKSGRESSRPVWFVRQGGKLILSGGWNNALVPAGAVLDYYNRVEARIGRENTRRGFAAGCGG